MFSQIAISWWIALRVDQVEIHNIPEASRTMKVQGKVYFSLSLRCYFRIIFFNINYWVKKILSHFILTVIFRKKIVLTLFHSGTKWVDEIISNRWNADKWNGEPPISGLEKHLVPVCIYWISIYLYIKINQTAHVYPSHSFVCSYLLSPRCY